MIEESQVVVHEADEPDLVGDLLDTNVLAGKYGAEMDLLTSEADPATLCDGDRLIMERIVELLKAVIEPAGVNSHILARSHYESLYGKDVTDPKLKRRTVEHLKTVLRAVLSADG